MPLLLPLRLPLLFSLLCKSLDGLLFIIILIVIISALQSRDLSEPHPVEHLIYSESRWGEIAHLLCREKRRAQLDDGNSFQFGGVQSDVCGTL